MSVRLALLALAACMLTALLAGCPQPEAESGELGTAHSSAGDLEQIEQADEAQQTTPSPADPPPPGEFFPPTGPPKQVILMYTGDTLSQATPRRELDSTEGGLSALAHAVSDYQVQIVDFNRLRVEEEGGDPASIRADLDAGMLGEHPFLLMDYGGWERPNDYAGHVYVALYFRYFTDFRYCAVAGRAYSTLSSKRWEAYGELSYPPTLLVTGAESVPGALASEPVVLRELHGQLWGIAAPPHPSSSENGDMLESFQQCLEAAEAELAGTECLYSIVLFAQAPTAIYRAQAEDSPFTVVIGADPRTGIQPGYGEMPDGGALLLPTLEPSGRQAAACHLYFEPDGGKPVMYNFIIIECPEDETQPWPYRRLVNEASQQHFELVKEHQAGE